MSLVIGQKYRIAYSEPRSDVTHTATGTYLGEEEALSVPNAYAFSLDNSPSVYVLISPDLLRSADALKERGDRVNGRLSQSAGTAG